MNPSVHRFRMQWQNRVMPNNGSLGPDYDECVDVANMWAENIGIRQSYGNANTLDFSPDCDWINNQPDNHPVPGDIVIWTGYPADPEFGHVALALFRCTVYRLRTLDQNFPDGTPCHVVNHTYEGVAGWWHPRKLGPHGTDS